MKYTDNKFVKEMSQLIKSILTFCKYKINLHDGELNIICSPEDVSKVILFFKDNPSLDMSCLIDIAGVDYPENDKRFTIVKYYQELENQGQNKYWGKPTNVVNY